MIQRIERSAGPLGGCVSTLMRIQSAFEKAGILFQDDDAGGGLVCGCRRSPSEEFGFAKRSRGDKISRGCRLLS